MLFQNERWIFVLAFAFGALIFGSYFYFDSYLGYDSYFFLDHVCGGGGLYEGASFSTVPPLANIVFEALPCNVFLTKLLFVGLLVASLLIIYYINRLDHGSEAWRAIPFTLIFPVFLFNSLKIENDPLSYPIMFASFYFFYKYLKQKKYFDLIASIILIGIAGLFWGGALYYVLYYTLFESLVLIVSFPLLLFFFGELSSGLIPNFGVDENNPFKFFRQVTVFFTLFLASNDLKSVSRKKWLMALPFLAVGLFNPKFLILLTPFISLILIEAWKNGDRLTRRFMTPLATIFAIIFILQIGFGWHGPTETEHDFVQESIRLANDQNLFLDNDWGLGHLIFFYGGETPRHSSIAEISCSDCIVLSYLEFPNCKVLQEENKLSIYKC